MIGGVLAAVAIYIIVLKKRTSATNPAGLDGDMYVGLTDDADGDLL